MIPPQAAHAPPPREIVTHAQLARVSAPPVPKPTPRPQPLRVAALRQTPPPERPRHLIRSFEGRAGVRRSSAASHPTVAHAAATRPVWDVAGAGGTAVAAAQSSGNADGGSGSGAGARGSGADAASGAEPCGFVTFSDPHGSQYDAHSHGFYVDIRMSVHFADGSSQTLVLDYPWYYPDEASNPWSAQNAKNPDFPTRFQPPPESQLSAEPELVRYVVAHSTPDGLTLLKDCPTG